MLQTSLDLKADLRGRIERVRAALRERKLAGLIVAGGGPPDPEIPDPLFYLTDFRALGPAWLILTVAGDATLVLSPMWDGARAREAVGVETVLAMPQEQLLAAVADAARSFAQSVALAGRASLSKATCDALDAALGAPPAEGDFVRELAVNRTPIEIERIERAAAIADVGFNAVRQLAQAGMREYELAAELEAAMQAAGAEDNAGSFTSGAKIARARQATDRRLERGDVIVAAAAPSYRGYFALLARTFVLGAATEPQRRAFAALVKAVGEKTRAPGPRDRNTILSVDVSQSSPETGFFMCADTFALEARGPRRLTQTPLELFWRAD